MQNGHYAHWIIGVKDAQMINQLLAHIKKFSYQSKTISQLTAV